jgi:hypothetical protein
MLFNYSTENRNEKLEGSGKGYFGIQFMSVSRAYIRSLEAVVPGAENYWETRIIPSCPRLSSVSFSYC